MKSPYKIVSVGGSIVIPKTGFDIAFLKKFRKLILDQVKKGDRFLLVVGGGATCRAYQDAAQKVTKISQDDLDWLGIHTTVFNAQFVRLLFDEYAYKDVVTNPKKKIKTTKPIIVAGGEKPGQSSDAATVSYAKTYKASFMMNLSNISHIYTKDPNKFKDAKQITDIDWKTLRKEIVGTKWVPGKNVPFDPTASKEAQKLNLSVALMDGTNLKEVKRALDGKSFEGTLIHP